MQNSDLSDRNLIPHSEFDKTAARLIASDPAGGGSVQKMWKNDWPEPSASARAAQWYRPGGSSILPLLWPSLEEGVATR